MQNERIISYTIIHLIVVIVFWTLLAGVIGLGFKDDWSMFDHAYALFASWGTWILSFPTWWLTMQDLPSWFIYLYIPIQVVSSFIQVSIFLYVCALFKKHNK